MVRSQRTTVPVDRLAVGRSTESNHQAHMTTALAAAVAFGDMFTMLAVDPIRNEGTAKPTKIHLWRPDFKPANHNQMLECKHWNKWIKGV